MSTIDTRIILDAGAQNIHNNHPDALIRRSALASLLVAARLVRSIDAGILSFRIWAEPLAKAHPVDTILNLANEKAAQT